jgi:hypothetical protein
MHEEKVGAEEGRLASGETDGISEYKGEGLPGRSRIFRCGLRHGRMSCMNNGVAWMGTTCMTGLEAEQEILGAPGGEG